MIALITIFFPSFIALYILHKRKNKDYKELIFLYPIYNIFINFLVLISIYIYNKGEVLILGECFNSLTFSLKYILLAIIISIIVPYLTEYINKNCHVIIDIKRENHEKKNK